VGVEAGHDSIVGGLDVVAHLLKQVFENHLEIWLHPPKSLLPSREVVVIFQPGRRIIESDTRCEVLMRESRDQDSKNRGVGEGEILTGVGNNLLQKFADPLLSRTATLCSPALSLPHATLGPYQFTQSDPLHTFDTGLPYSLGANQRVPWIAAADTATTRRPWPVRRRCPPSSTTSVDEGQVFGLENYRRNGPTERDRVFTGEPPVPSAALFSEKVFGDSPAASLLFS
jgi:hypothetical protein